MAAFATMHRYEQQPDYDPWTERGSYWVGVGRSPCCLRSEAMVRVGDIDRGCYRLWYEAVMLTGRRRANPVHFVNLTICELVMRLPTYKVWGWYGVESAG